MNPTTQITSQALSEVEISGMTRESFLLRSALAAGAVYGVGMISPFMRQAIAAEQMDDLGILNFALTLEYLEATFYARALSSLKLSGDVGAVAKIIAKDEAEHVAALTATIKKLGGTPVAAPKVAFPMKDEKSFLMLAQVFEDTGVSAYNGAAPGIKNKDILGAAGSIVQVEARHAAVIRLLNKQTPAPNAFDPSLTADKVLTAVKPFIKA